MKLRNTNTTNQDAARETAIVQNIDLVNNVARRLQRRVPPCVTFDDLVSAGMIGLIQAVDRFDRSRDLKFKTYAQYRIRGAMLDFLREEDPLSRGERRRVRESASTAHVTISLDQLSAPAANRLVRCETRTVSDLAMSSEVRTARRCLSDRENRVIAMLFDLGCQSREVAADLKVNESRVSQIKHRALAKLRMAVGASGRRMSGPPRRIAANTRTHKAR